MTTLIGIDPGPRQSGYVILENGRVTVAKTRENDALIAEDLTAELSRLYKPVVVCEWLQSYGQAVGQDVFRSCFFCGRVAEICRTAGVRYIEMTRPDVCRALCGNTQGVKKTHVRRALLDAFMGRGDGGGSEPAIGTAKQPGPLYLMRGSDHAWDALAVVEAWRRQG